MTGNDSSRYAPDTLERVKATALTVVQVLGDAIVSDAVVVGGLVPTLLYEGTAQNFEFGAHIGTMDLDLTLGLAILDGNRYEHIQAGLRANGFSRMKNRMGSSNANHGDRATASSSIF